MPMVAKPPTPSVPGHAPGQAGPASAPAAPRPPMMQQGPPPPPAAVAGPSGAPAAMRVPHPQATRAVDMNPDPRSLPPLGGAVPGFELPNAQLINKLDAYK